MQSKPNRNQNKSTFSLEDFAKALEAHDYHQFAKGQIVSGKVYSHDTDGAYVDIGAKSLAFLPWHEIVMGAGMTHAEAMPLEEEREFLIVRDQTDDGQFTLSLRQLQLKKVWNELDTAFADNKTVQVHITGVNKGGVTVDYHALRGFIPRSQLMQQDNLPSLVGQSVMVNIITLDQDNKKLVFSQKQAMQTAGFNQLEIGQLIEGKVVNIKPFGLFVDLDGVTGLVHIKQISQNQIDKPLPDLFPIGKFVKVIIIDLDEGSKRISLSMKLLENYPGEILEKMDEVFDSAEPRAERARKALQQNNLL